MFLLSKGLFQRYIPFISASNVTKEVNTILIAIREYYATIEGHEYLSSDELKTWFHHLNPNIKDAELYDNVFERLASLDVSESIAHEVVKNLIEKDYSNKIVNTLIPVLEDATFGVMTDVKKLIDEYEEVCQLKKDEDSPFVDDDLEQLLEENVTGDGINWRLNCLNNDIGPLRGGSLGHVFARVDSGKTSFLASEVTHFAQQLKDDECILWFNNEEKGGKVRLRTYQASLNALTASIVSNVDKAKELYEERGGNKIKIYDDASISVTDIKKVLKKFRPRIVIIDQGDKVSFAGQKDMANHDRLKALYQKFRELAKEFNCDILTVGQASAETHGRKWLDLDQMDSSKTGKPGELDYAIGIGCSFAEGDEELRFIHICKNKCKDGVHGKHVALFDAAKARYKDV